jgi:hypothetical protein
VTTTFTVAGDGSLKKTLHTKPSAALPKLAHELIDQLTVISLCRFKIHETFARHPKNSTKDCEALEDAVREVARLIEEITKTLSNPSCSHKSVVRDHKPARNRLRIIK